MCLLVVSGDSWRWNQTGETITGLPGNGLNAPWNLFFDSTTENLYIADLGNHRILQWNRPLAMTAIVAGVTGSSGTDSLRLNTPRDVFVDASGNLYVADSLNQRIQFYLNGSLTGVTLTTSWRPRGELWGVQMFSQMSYALDKVRSSVWMNGTVAASSSLNGPQGFAIDTSVAPGTMYIVNSQQQTVVQWSPGVSTGQVVAGIDGTVGSANNLLHIPIAVKLDSDANLFVVDNNNHRIQLFCRPSSGTNFTGRMILGTGASGQTAQTLNYPAGIALDSSKNIYVADTTNNRIQRFQRLV